MASADGLSIGTCGLCCSESRSIYIAMKVLSKIILEKRMGGWMNGWMDGFCEWMDGVNGWMDR